VELESTISENFYNTLNKLRESNNHHSFYEESYKHFNDRGLEVFTFEGHEHFRRYFPIGIPISVSKGYLDKMKVPDQNTSYLMTKAKQNGSEYIFNIPGRKGGGISDLTGGVRSVLDDMAATLNEIFFGYHAITIALGNWMANYSQVLKGGLFLQHLPAQLKEEALLIRRSIYENMGAPDEPYLAIGIRSNSSMNKLFSSGPYKKHLFATLNPKNSVKMIFITSQSVKEIMSKEIPESDHVSYISTGKDYDTYKGILALRAPPYNIKKMLNDGGAEYSNYLRDSGLLSGQRITKVPWPGPGFIPEDIVEKYPQAVLGRDGASTIDGSEIEKGIRIFSRAVASQKSGLTEWFNVYLHEMDEKKIV
jgi:hypothetical protein